MPLLQTSVRVKSIMRLNLIQNLHRVRKRVRVLPIFLLSKRQRLILVTLFLSLGLFAVQMIKMPEQRLLIIILFGIVSYFVTSFALFEDLDGVEWLTLLVLPTLFCVTSALFIPLLPRTIDSILLFPLLPDEARVVALFLKFLFVLMFMVGFYFLLLTENIFNVSAVRTIQLLRVAHAVGFLFTLIVSFFFFNILMSFQLHGFVNSILTFVFSFPIFLQGLWSVNLEDGITYSVGRYSFVLSLCLSQISLAISFWPLEPTLSALFLTAIVYEFLGIAQHHFASRLFRRAVYEFAIVALIIFIVMFVMARWNG